MDYKGLLKHLENVSRKQENFAPIYLIYGPDGYLRYNAVRQIEKYAAKNRKVLIVDVTGEDASKIS